MEKKKKIFAVTENFNTAALAPPPAKRFLAFNKREYTPAMIYNMLKVHLCLNKWPEMTERYTDSYHSIKLYNNSYLSGIRVHTHISAL